MQADVSNKKKPQVVLSFGGCYYGVSTMYVVLNCAWSGFFVLIWCLVVPPIPTIDEILKCPPQPPLYEFVYGFGQIDWYAKIPSTTSHVVLMTSHLNEWSWNFSKFSNIFFGGLCESYPFSKDGNRDMGMGQSMPKRWLWTPPKVPFGKPSKHSH